MIGRQRFIRIATLGAALIALGATSAAVADHGTLVQVSSGPDGGNGSFGATFRGSSSDGARGFFTTNESLVAADTDAQTDVYERFGSTTTLISTGQEAGLGSAATYNGASADGTRVFFTTSQSLAPTDVDGGQPDIYERSGGTTTQISTGPQNPNGFGNMVFQGNSADGSKVFFTTADKLVAADTDGAVDIYERAGATTSLVSTGSAGGNGAFQVTFRGATPDGTHVYFTTDESLEPSDTDSSRDVYDRVGPTTAHVSIGSAGGNAAIVPTFQAVSTDGTRVFFTTPESLEAGDSDGQVDIYERSAGTTTLISTGSLGGNGALGAGFGGISADGTRVVFTSNDQLEPDDTDSATDVYERSGSTTTRISTGTSGGNSTPTASFAGVSSDGARVFFFTNEALEPDDTDSSRDIYVRQGATTTRISAGPAGGNGAFIPAFVANSSDGARAFFTTTESLESGDTDTQLDIYERSGTTTTRISAAASAGNGAFAPTFGGISADGARAFFATDEQLLQTDADSVADVYAAGPAVTAGYPRPVGATPLRVSLVPAYEECTAPNTTHAAPFAFDSCNPPVPVSDFLTVGTPDANGQGAKSTGFVKVAAVVGVPGGADDADARIEVRITDVRNQGDLSDYTGELQVTSLLRLTDKANGPAQTTPATVPDFPLVATVPCSATGDTTIGAACVLNTTLDTLVPGAVKEGKRAIYRLNDVQVFDGGPDGDVDTGAGNTVFAWQGFFVP